METKHDTENVFDMLGTNNTSETTETPKAKETTDTTKTTKAPKKKGRPQKTEEEKKGGYRYNLNLDKSVRRYIYNKAWQDRVSASDYINKLIKADMEKYYRKGGTEEGWIDPPAEGKAK